jgi:7-cyano-7-deazaguanine synthase
MIAEVGNKTDRTFMAMRNALFLTIAANRASFLNLKNIFIGISQEDTANFPDCTFDFLNATQEYINASLGVNDFKVHAPLLTVKKNDSILLASTMPDCWEALAHTHTSYDGVMMENILQLTTIMLTYCELRLLRLLDFLIHLWLELGKKD